MIRAMGAGSGDEVMRRGWEALAEADWDSARSRFEEACKRDETAEALDGLGRALHFQGEYTRGDRP